jgi:hypothetical protein
LGWLGSDRKVSTARTRYSDDKKATKIHTLLFAALTLGGALSAGGGGGGLLLRHGEGVLWEFG